MALSDKRVVICEDEGIIQMQLQRILTTAGMKVVGEASSGDEAVEVSLRERPDVIIMDINVPGINGLEAARRILTEYKPCLIVLTAYTDQDHKQEAWCADICAYITKPISKELFQAQVEQALAAHEFRS